MGAGYKAGSPDDLRVVTQQIQRVDTTIDDLARPSGTNTANLYKQVQIALSSVDTKVQQSIAANSYTKAQIDARVQNPALSGPVSTATSARFDGGIFSSDTYNRLVTYGGPYRTMSAHQDGTYGYAPSSSRFKQDITNWSIDVSLLPQMRPVTFRYIEDVKNNGTSASVHAGLVAEEVHALGLTELVDYDETGKPFGVKYDLVAVALVKLVQMRAAQRSRQTVTQTLPAVSLVQATLTIDVTWPSAMVDADYTVVADVTSPTGIIATSVACLVPGSRTPRGCKVTIRTIGVALSAGNTLTVEGLHL